MEEDDQRPSEANGRGEEEEEEGARPRGGGRELRQRRAAAIAGVAAAAAAARDGSLGRRPLGVVCAQCRKGRVRDNGSQGGARGVHTKRKCLVVNGCRLCVVCRMCRAGGRPNRKIGACRACVCLARGVCACVCVWVGECLGLRLDPRDSPAH
jgi:hypothetical protein